MKNILNYTSTGMMETRVCVRGCEMRGEQETSIISSAIRED